MEKPPGNPQPVVKPQFFTFGGPPNEFILESGQKIGPVTIAYETYGELNKDKTNAILILHALSGDAHVAGYHEGDNKPGWWDLMVGPGKAMDTNKYFVLCSNVLGSCYGSTGPSSVNPKTGKPYGLSFPVVTISDMVKAQKALLDSIGISQLVTVIGGSMGGMQAIEWTLQFPDVPKSAIVIASCAALSDQEIAFDTVGRNAIKADTEWENGEYYGRDKKLKGLAIARMIGHITYLSEEGMAEKFKRRLQSGEKNLSYKIRYEKEVPCTTGSTVFDKDFEREFAVESYLAYQGEKFVKRFDANSYLYITKAMDYYDAAAKWGGGSLKQAMKRTKAEFLLISFTSDMLFSPDQSKAIVEALRVNNKDVSYIEIDSKHGHDAFLLEKKTMNENKILSQAIKNFLLHSRV
ncbi:MAG: Homoserine O-acetyltransferase [Candidatus Aerophobetes bacterium ADurb.Bin490]|nr:MAG: Homoserine O-acetyltransferase [Candidatus Aerophobetes bacterium ADurb.Bin490]HPI02778.1 homoserine O-acetyltransferase [Candidatus Goldiibacteriota bacterium]HPN63731.1 homoserine O-acetyltransferase [Candidatus Goldiibacteriota bacterium]HRQ44429.1 homoserine O-acetyltransferase [Candidatus Goldiibacteriota bacterium]